MGAKQFRTGALQKALKKNTEDNKAQRKRRHSEGDGYSFKQRQVTSRNTG